MRVQVFEVGPRDGLQAIEPFVDTGTKRDLIDALYSAGVDHIEEVSFAHPRIMPQMKDAEDVFSGRGSALVMNQRGFDRAMAAGVSKVNVVLSACEQFSLKNLRRTNSEMVHSLFQILNDYPKEAVRVYISMSFGSPYSGQVEKSAMKSLIRDAGMLGDTVVFADTVGVGTKAEVRTWAEMALDAGLRPALHLHHRGDESRALSLVRAGLLHGIKEFDSSIGGLGGCPFAVGSGANLSTETLVRHLHAWGFETGIDLEHLKRASAIAKSIRGLSNERRADSTPSDEGPATLVQREVGGRQPQRQGWETPALWPF